MENKIYKVTYKVNGRNMSKKFDSFIDAEEVYITRCRDSRCSDVDIKCLVNGIEKYIPSYMFSF